MRKKGIGLCLLVLAVMILFQEYLPRLSMPVWKGVLLAGAACCLVLALIKGAGLISWLLASWLFMGLNAHYHWLAISNGAIFLASLFLYVGFGYFTKKSTPVFSFSSSIKGAEEADVVFSTSSRYITDQQVSELDGDIVLSRTSLYFDKAEMAGQEAIYSGDVVFSRVTLYLPRHWSVEIRGDQVFSSVAVRGDSKPGGQKLVFTGDVVFSRLELVYV